MPKPDDPSVDLEKEKLALDRAKLELERTAFEVEKSRPLAVQHLPIAIAFAGVLVSVTQIWSSYYVQARNQDLEALKTFLANYNTVFKSPDPADRAHIQALINNAYGKNQLVLFGQAFLDNARTTQEFAGLSQQLRTVGAIPMTNGSRVFVLFSSPLDGEIADGLIRILREGKHTVSDKHRVGRVEEHGTIRYFNTEDGKAAEALATSVSEFLKSGGVLKKVNVEIDNVSFPDIPRNVFEIVLPQINKPAPAPFVVPKFSKKGT